MSDSQLNSSSEDIQTQRQKTTLSNIKKFPKFAVQESKKLNHINLFTSSQQSTFKCHFQLRKIYMPRAEKIIDYFNRIIKYLQLEGKVGVAQLINVYKNQLVDIGLGLYYDKDAIKLIEDNTWFRLLNSQRKYVLIKPQLSYAFKFYVQKNNIKAIKQTQTIIPHPKFQQKQHSQTKSELLNKNLVCQQPDKKNKLVMEMGQIQIEKPITQESHKSKSRSRSKSKTKRKNLEERLQSVSQDYNEKRVFIYILGVPKQFGRKQIFKALKYHTKGEFLLKTWTWKSEDDIPYFEISLSDCKMSQVLLQDCLDVEGIPVLILEKVKNKPLKTILCDYQIRVISNSRKIIPFTVYKFFRSYGKIVHFCDLSENVCIITFGKKQTIAKIPKNVSEYRIQKIQKHQVVKINRLSLNNIFYTYIEKDQPNYNKIKTT